MITMLLSALAAVVFLATVVGDVTIGALVAGVFSIANTLITTVVLRDVRETKAGVRHTHRVLSAPRRAVYDNQGHIVGTMLRLEHDEDWTGRLLPPQRASDIEDDPS